MTGSLRRHLIKQALRVWAPDWPRRITQYQTTARTTTEAIDALVGAEGGAPFISVYSFPRGHTRDGSIPDIDTLFIDFDFEGGDYTSGSGDRAAWRRDLSHLLVRVRKVAQFLDERGRDGWRASLSGHKGVHLFLDFPAIDPTLGGLAKYKAGTGNYADQLVDKLAAETGIGSLSDYVDVTSSDMGRLCRVPNTRHDGASASFGEPRFCVPVSVSELARIDVDTYESLTQSPRPVPWTSRTPNQDVGDIIEQQVSMATPGGNTYTANGDLDWGRVDAYKKRSNDNIHLEDIPLITKDRPFVADFPNRDDVWDHGFQSHFMELFCIAELVNKNVPIEVIKDFFAQAPGYDERYTERKIKEVIASSYDRFNIETLEQKAPVFCS